ncbi:efflux RND transporter permease subunit [Bryobacter aggregatus]|uniref:efflux RND transporter permease subunit n=1 Tax=Bryobacter aggregatus TaxID=360054 RepID=UPI0004E1B830|nr:efflux RND transporter permease subunit [Bryobacter aggregatus]
MWIVRLSLNRPYTIAVLAVLILLLGSFALVKTPTDIFPEINVPQITVIWNYQGLPTPEMEKRVTTFSEFVLALVNDVKSIESQTLSGVSVIKIYFHENVRIDSAMAQVNSAVNSIRFRMPPGINPPWILRFSASSVPVIQLSLSSKTLPESALYDYGIYRVRQQLSVVRGALLPAPYGGVDRQVMVDLDPQAITARGLSPIDVSNAVQAQNLMLPSGNAKVGPIDYQVSLNSNTDTIAALNDLPVKNANGVTTYVRDIGNVRDGAAVQINAVRKDGEPAVLLSIIKTGGASTLDIIDQVKNEILPVTRASAPPGLDIQELFDQSVFVRGAIDGVVHEGIIAALLTAAMILLFLGSWRSTLIIAVSIPLSILTSILALSAMGHTLNVMTLGGLALAIGILVDDATVEIENIHRIMSKGGTNLRDGILTAASQIAGPTFVSTLVICIVFVSVVFLTGPAKFLFTPMALAVVFAMAASYLLSRTLVPTLVYFLLPSEEEENHGLRPKSRLTRVVEAAHLRFNRVFTSFAQVYEATLRATLAHRNPALFSAGLVMATGFVLAPFVGKDFFPTVDAGQIRLHVRATPGTRLEETKRLFTTVNQAIRRVVPAEEIELVLDNIGRSSQPFNLAFGDGATIGTFDGEISISLKHGHAPTADYVRRLREELPKHFPGTTFYFQPADMVSQILNFGLPAPVNVQVAGYGGPANLEIAKQIEERMRKIPGLVDVHLHQVVDAPALKVEVDRERAAEFGLTQQDVANNVFVSLASSAQVQPNFWLDPRMGMTYMVAVQTPQTLVSSLNDIENTPVQARNADSVQLLSNIAHIRREKTVVNATHTNVQPTFDVYASVQDTDLGSVATAVDQIAAEFRPKLAAGNTITVRGQVESMNSAFSRLSMGLAASALLVYLLMVVNFQSWSTPFVIITALPGALTGIVWALFLTQSTFNVPSLMGAIMSIGVATANSILLVTFAQERVEEGLDAFSAALEAGSTRLRPILMTAAAMVIGMLPMAFGLGEGGEQNAPLARAVIGGLTLATVSTLLFVPLIFTMIRKNRIAA